MSDPYRIDPDDGFMEVAWGDHPPVRVDVWEANNRLFQVEQDTEGKPAHERHAGYVAVLELLGLPKVSHRQADLFAAKIYAAAGGLEGKAEGATDAAARSHASTDSTASSTPPTGPTGKSDVTTPTSPPSGPPASSATGAVASPPEVFSG